MKLKLLSTLLAIGLFSSLQASSNVYTGISLTTFATEDEKVLSIQPIDELIGKGSEQLEIKVGYNAFRSSNSDKARIYLYAWNAPDKNNEVGFGFGGEYLFENLNSIPNLQFSIGSQVGYGWQGVKGDNANISTSANKLSYVTDTINTNPTTITYTEDSYVLDINLIIGTTYHISNNFDLEFSYIYKNSEYQVEYRTAERNDILNALTFNQDSHGLRIGLNYQF